MWTVRRNPTIRRSDLVCHNPESTGDFEWPTKARIDQVLASGVLHHFIGFENNKKDGTGIWFNFLLSNGDRSKQRDKNMTYYDHMMPAGSHTRIRSVNIHYFNAIIGFSFLDKEGALLWKIGETTNRMNKVETVLIEDNEVIIGVIAKLYGRYQSCYTDFQFQIGKY